MSGEFLTYNLQTFKVFGTEFTTEYGPNFIEVKTPSAHLIFVGLMQQGMFQKFRP
jgi:hypothetical protein